MNPFRLQRSLCGVLVCLLSAATLPGEPAPTHDVRAEQNVMVAMRDGVKLATDLYFPDGIDGRLPVVLWRSVYDKTGAIDREPGMRNLVQQGYVAVIQNTRGRGESEGNFVPSGGDRDDAWDTVDWIVRQPWASGKVGSAGCSALGETQLLLAATRHPNHVAAVPMSATSAVNDHARPWAAYNGGMFELAQTAGWFASDADDGTGRPVDFRVLPTVDILKAAGRPRTAFEDFVASTPDGPYFRILEWLREGDQTDVPALTFDSWYDYGPAEALYQFNKMRGESISARARDNQFVVIAPGTHCAYANATEHTRVGERDLGDARFDVFGLQLQWFDYWLKGIDNGVTRMPRVQYYLMGANRWQTADTWPVPGTSYKRFYLASEGGASSGEGILADAPQPEAAVDAYQYDPGNPVPTVGGHTCCTGGGKAEGSYDQREVERRPDVLVYTSAPLERGIEVTGPLKVVLSVSSSAVDTDFTARLVDVYPDGRAFNVQDGGLRMRYRDGYDKDLRMQAGEIYEVELDLHATANYFGAGHRIRLDISSSNFPRWDRNLNTGGSNYNETVYVIATNTVHHSAEHPSYLVLPVVDRRPAGGDRGPVR